MRIAAIKSDKLGDAILTEPAFRALKKYRAEHLTLILNKYIAPLFKGYQWSDRIIEYDPSPKGIKELAEKLRGEKFHEVFVFTPKSIAYKTGTALQAEKRYSYVYASRMLAKVYWSMFYKMWVDPVDMALPKSYEKGEVLHEIEQNMKVLELVGIKPSDEDLELKLPIEPEEIEKGLSFWRKFPTPHVLVATRKGMLEGDLLTRLQEKLGEVDLVFSASPEESGNIPSSIPSERIFTPSDLRDFISVLATADVVIAPNSAPLHLASAFKRPVIALYPARNFEFNVKRWGPWRTYNRIVKLSGNSTSDAEEIALNLSAALRELNFTSKR